MHNYNYASGLYGFAWTPDSPSDNTIIATFTGSGAHDGSSAQTYFHASALASTPSTSSLTVQPTEMYTIDIGISITIAMIVGFVVIIPLLRKRPQKYENSITLPVWRQEDHY